VAALDLLVERGLSPPESLAQDRFLLREAGGGATGALRVYDVAGAVVSLGRYHLAPPPTGGDVRLLRRHSGGRAVPFGDGFIGVALTLPHRSALVSPADPSALTPTQVLNRYVRGILGACALMGIPAFYPGRDLVTAGRRLLGLVSFEVDRAGALLFEAVLATTRDFSDLPALLDAVDPGGIVRADLVNPTEATCLSREVGRPLETDEVAAWLQRGYEERLGASFTRRTLREGERAAIAGVASAEMTEARWLAARRPRLELDRRASASTPLGVLEVHLARTPEGHVGEVMLLGDFLAPSDVIRRLEERLAGCPARREAIDAVVRDVFRDASDFVLGVGPLQTITETVVKALDG
jgi:lipoate-protein ligase A